MNYRIFPPEEIIDGTVTLPASKSYVNRSLAIDFLAGLPLPETDPALCGTDIATMRSLLEAAARRDGLAGPATLDVGDAGTAMRFLTALLAATPGADFLLTGSERMCRRPIGPLVEALRALGASVSYAGEEGFPPLRISGRRLDGGEVEIDASVSSQFVSALMLAAPGFASPLTIRLAGVVKSKPYIELTRHIMALRGIDTEFEEGRVITVGPGRYNSERLTPEADWSAFAFWAELCAVTAGFITVAGADTASKQPDRASLNLFAELGAVVNDDEDDDDDEEERRDDGCDGPAVSLCGSPELTPRLIHDFSATPDLVQPAMVACALIGIPFKFTGVESLRIKETDRIEALRVELLKMGVVIDIESASTVSWEGQRRPIAELPRFESHGDHRMAMALAPAAAFMPGVVICGAECVAKSYPRYWEELASLGFTLTDGDLPLEQPTESDDE